MSSTSSLGKQINTIQQSNLLPRYHVQMRPCQIPPYTRAKDSTDSVLDMRTRFKPTETFHYTFFTTCHPPGAKKGFVKGRLFIRTNSSNKKFEENITTFKKHHMERGYPQNIINNTLSEVKFQEGTKALLQRNKTK